MPTVDTIHRVRRGSHLYSFGDPIESSPICGRPLGEWQERAAKANGLRLKDVEPDQEVQSDRALRVEEDLFFSESFLAKVLQQCEGRTTSTRFGLHRNDLNRAFVLPLGSEDPERPRPLGMSLEIVTPSGSSDAPEVVAVDQVVHEGEPHRVPEQVVRGGGIHLPISWDLAGPVSTPFHLLRMNTAVLLSRFAKGRGRWPAWLVERLAPYRSPGFYRALRRANQIGKGCRIHPTAVLEGAVIGDDVTIGAHCVVRLSRVGRGSTLDDQASVTFSVLGERNYVATKNHITFSLTYDDVFTIHGPYQFSIFGRGSAVFAVIAGDVRMDARTIRIPTPEGLVDSGQPLLGNAYGHGCKVAGGNVLLPGRIVPNGVVVPPPAESIARFPKEVP